MRSEIIQSVAYDDFQTWTSYFHKKIISLFWGLFNDKKKTLA
jgi:hypothetical protein